MCGRYSLFADFKKIEERFGEATFDVEEYEESYNIAPSQMILSVVNDGLKNRIGYLKWGLVPPWAKDPKIGFKMINARAETVHDCVAIAPTPALAYGTTAPTLKNLEATATPNSFVSGSKPTIEYVMRPCLLITINCTSSNIFKCFITAYLETSKCSLNSPVDSGPFFNKSRISTRVGWDSALNR